MANAGSLDSGLRQNDGKYPLSHAWEGVRSDEVETLDIVGGEGTGSAQLIQDPDTDWDLNVLVRTG